MIAFAFSALLLFLYCFTLEFLDFFVVGFVLRLARFCFFLLIVLVLSWCLLLAEDFFVCLPYVFGSLACPSFFFCFLLFILCLFFALKLRVRGFFSAMGFGPWFLSLLLLVFFVS